MVETRALIIGNGGREHAIAEQIAPAVDRLYYTGSNAGIEGMQNAISIEDLDPVDFATNVRPDLVVIGPEKPLVEGVGNKLRAEGITVFGPSEEAAELEASKYFGRRFMQRHQIASPRWNFVEDFEEYHEVKSKFSDATLIVVKADGLAGGKGVVLPDSWEESDETVKEMLEGTVLGGAGKEGLLIEERCHGPEVSMFVLSDGENFKVLPFTQDHKRRNDGDRGKNTGGMGAYTIPEGKILTARQIDKLHEIAQKSIEGMKADGIPYRGVMYVGTMMAEEYDDDPIVIEYNVRFGDPEAQVLISLLGENTFDVLASTDTRLREDLLAPAKLAGQTALTVCLAAKKYPDSGDVGTRIYGLNYAAGLEDISVYHGGTKKEADGNIVTNGGRILYVTGRGETVDHAAERAYGIIGLDKKHGISFSGMHYRTDIGHQVRTK